MDLENLGNLPASTTITPDATRIELFLILIIVIAPPGASLFQCVEAAELGRLPNKTEK